MESSGGSGVSSVKELEAKYKDQTDYLHVSEGKDSIQLSNIVIKKGFRGQGIGSRFMRDLIDYADRVHKVITLTPTSEFGSSLGRLKEFYKGFGFVENKGRRKNFEISDSMYRIPG